MRSTMVESLVGAGGWGYFSGGLEAYAKAFRFVEVNATFYRQIADSTARRWRAPGPSDFVFSAKTPPRVSHGHHPPAAPHAPAAFPPAPPTPPLPRPPLRTLRTPAPPPLAPAPGT